MAALAAAVIRRGLKIIFRVTIIEAGGRKEKGSFSYIKDISFILNKRASLLITY